MIENFKNSTLYVQKLVDIKDERIFEIEKESIKNSVPIITREVLDFMLFEAKRIKSKNILEIGTATGFSGIFLAQIANENNGKLTTIEIDEKRYNIAKENFRKMGLEDKNNLIFGDALEELDKLDVDTKYDFIFIDASKGQYKKFFDKSYKLLSDNGTIFIDNIMFRGIVAEEVEIPKRYRTIVKKLKDFIEELKSKYNFILLPFGDGVGIVRK